MKCPHCLENFHADSKHSDLLRDKVGDWKVSWTVCPVCERVAIFLSLGTNLVGEASGRVAYVPNAVEIMVWPKGIARAPLPKEVTDEFNVDDYREACLVLTDSPKASAALSRRCLQHLLREKVGVKPSILSNEIDEVINSKTLPSDLAEAIDAIRIIGNFAAHPTKNTNTGEIVDVEVGEAEWNLDVLENLFDFYFVRPAQLAAKKTALNQKLSEAGKPPMK